MTDADIIFEFYNEKFSPLLNYVEKDTYKGAPYRVSVYQKYTLISCKPAVRDYMVFLLNYTSDGILVMGVYTYTSYTRSYKPVSKIAQRRAAALLLRESY